MEYLPELEFLAITCDRRPPDKEQIRSRVIGGVRRAPHCCVHQGSRASLVAFREGPAPPGLHPRKARVHRPTKVSNAPRTLEGRKGHDCPLRDPMRGQHYAVEGQLHRLTCVARSASASRRTGAGGSGSRLLEEGTCMGIGLFQGC
jgi:hypothetical protein